MYVRGIGRVTCLFIDMVQLLCAGSLLAWMQRLNTVDTPDVGWRYRSGRAALPCSSPCTSQDRSLDKWLLLRQSTHAVRVLFCSRCFSCDFLVLVVVVVAAVVVIVAVF